MNQRNPAFVCLRTSLVTAAFTSALLVGASLVSASLAHAQPVNSRADHGNGGPGEFADLAERVGPAVIGVNAKVAAAADDDDSSPGDSPGGSLGPDGSPDQDTPGRTVPKSRQARTGQSAEAG
ncbi:hypothetical protein RX327_18710 [Bradyrhizobium sp. BEA-2-5]|uniref:hypothetical protein n=1 Tax=Bradyrhizobium sp. BEA-2-5 TaxID=3080015 RepID=UPI00293F78EC|nr:hypothetical protein [Bradyrhizobium sp. BEA-2-5]WOH85029.1 hypothetical protein RX327_18710 [Bradyrhizobium sp. BEA-2-5]